MSDPVGPVWHLKEFQLTVPFSMKGELEYQSWTDLERTLTGNVAFGSLPQLRFEFGQTVSRLQGGLGLQVWQTELPRIGPFVTSVGVDAMMKWADSQQFSVIPGIDLTHVQWPSFKFSIEGSLSLSGLDQGGHPKLEGEISGNLKFNFDLFAPKGTFHKK